MVVIRHPKKGAGRHSPAAEPPGKRLETRNFGIVRQAKIRLR
jgi:hypothetical protein